MVFLRDGYIVGVLRSHLGRCPLCRETKQRVLDLAEVNTPYGFTIEATLLWDKTNEQPYSAIGFSCGCYAKWHRQVAHIVDSQARAGRLV